MADTTPEAEPVAVVEESALSVDEPAAEAVPAVLDDEQLEKVARRVVELLSESVIRDVAWEAVPEIAERLIRERISEIEAEADAAN